MEFSYDKANSVSTSKIATSQLAVQCNIKDMNSTYNQLLCAKATCKVNNVENIGNAVKVKGRVFYKLIIGDDENSAVGGDYYSDFEENITAGIPEGSMLYGECKVLDVSGTKDKAMVTAIIEISIYSTVSSEREVLVNVPNNCYADKKMASLVKSSTVCMNGVAVSDSFTPGGNVDKIILTDYSGIIVEVKVTDTILVIGEVIVNVTYQMGESIYVKNMLLPFEQQITGDFSASMRAIANVTLNSSRVVIGGVEGDNEIDITVEGELNTQVYDMTEFEYVSDMYCLDNELQLKMGKISAVYPVEHIYYEDKISGVSKIESSEPIISILGVASCSNEVMNTSYENDKITVNGIINACVMYRTEQQVKIESIEIPYNTVIELTIPMDVEMRVKGIVQSITAKLKREQEIEILADIPLTIDCVMKKDYMAIEQVEIGSVCEKNESAVSIYIAEEGETLWNVSKLLSTIPDVLREYNEGIEEILHKGQKITIYRQLNIAF